MICCGNDEIGAVIVVVSRCRPVFQTKTPKIPVLKVKIGHQSIHLQQA
jgi:hypothetical protein